MAQLTTRAALGTRPAEIIAEELKDLKRRIADNIINEGSNASGRTIESLETEVLTEDSGATTGTLYGRSFFGALETGSRPWTNQYKHPPVFFQEIIREWIDAKGLDLSAYLVARKIMRSGSALYRQGGRDTIYSQEIPKTLDSIRDRVLAFWTVAAVEHIKLNNTSNENN